MELNKDMVLKAWKDEEYRSTLPADVQKQIPARPTQEDGSAMTDEQLADAAGGTAFLTPAAPFTVEIGTATAGGIAAGFGAGIAD